MPTGRGTGHMPPTPQGALFRFGSQRAALLTLSGSSCPYSKDQTDWFGWNAFRFLRASAGQSNWSERLSSWGLSLLGSRWATPGVKPQPRAPIFSCTAVLQPPSPAGLPWAAYDFSFFGGLFEIWNMRFPISFGPFGSLSGFDFHGTRV
jgi:hypothetical protein